MNNQTTLDALARSAHANSGRIMIACDEPFPIGHIANMSSDDGSVKGMPFMLVSVASFEDLKNEVRSGRGHASWLEPPAMHWYWAEACD